MCLLGIGLGLFDAFPLLVLANREEFYARPTVPPRLFPRQGETAAWLGGLDLLAGGTWLGVNEQGLVVAVTNRRKQAAPITPPSRGILCRSLLAERDAAGATAAALGALNSTDYAGCNLLIADCDSAVVIEAGDALKATPLGPGLHLIANADLNPTADGRVDRVRREFADCGAKTAADWFAAARRICALPAERDAPAICLDGTDRGTVSSTVLGIGSERDGSQYWHAPGAPASTAYDDYTPMLRQLLRGEAGEPPDAAGSTTVQTASLAANSPLPNIEPPDDSPARRAARESATHEVRPAGEPAEPAAGTAAAYRIYLRGPWESRPLARAERDAGGVRVWSAAGLPPAGNVRLPASWQHLFGDFRGRVCFRRRFHPPSNVTAADRLSIVLDAAGGTGTVSVNGRCLGTFDGRARSAAFDMTGLLSINNMLEIELEFTQPGAECPGGLHAPVALEIGLLTSS